MHKRIIDGKEVIENEEFDNYKSNYRVNTFLNFRDLKNLHFSLERLKQVATVRITKLK